MDAIRMIHRWEFRSGLIGRASVGLDGESPLTQLAS
jgi:hypothetical protein